MKNPFLQVTGTGFNLNTSFLSTLQSSFLCFASYLIDSETFSNKDTLFSLFDCYTTVSDAKEKIEQSLCTLDIRLCL